MLDYVIAVLILVLQLTLKGFPFWHLCFRNRDVIDEENPYDAVTIEEDTKIYEDLVSYQKVVPVRRLLLIGRKLSIIIVIGIQGCQKD